MSITSPNASLLEKAYQTLNLAFSELPAASPFAAYTGVSRGAEGEALSAVLQATATRLQDNYPYHHPNYAGQMLKPPHPVAQLAYTLAQSINPNNHALDGGRASSAMEKEAVAHIATMLGFGGRHLGHLCSGGTVANLEALWVAREQSTASTRVLSSEFSHYTHSRLAGVLGIEHSSVAADDRGRMSVAALRSELDQGNVGTVVATLGTTGFGAVDPLAEIVALKKTYGFRLHVDAAYGGYFRLLPEIPVAGSFAATALVDSVVIDPHKHGLQPYGCGCVLFANPADGKIYAHESPYTYFSSDEMHLGEISLECSRAGASAVALWATQRALPNVVGGEFAAALAASWQAAQRLYGWLNDSPHWQPLLEPDLDVVSWIPRADSLQQASAASQAVYDDLAKRDIHVALLRVPAEFACRNIKSLVRDADTVTCLRVCLMKPEHDDWLEYFFAALDELTAGGNNSGL